MNNVIITQLKNQSGRMLDWILYHWTEGFDTFIIYDDHSEDSTLNEIEQIKNKYGINIFVFKTENIGRVYNIDECKNSESYLGDHNLSLRIFKSYLKSNNFVKEQNPDAICAVIDVDEFLVTNENRKVSETIREIILEMNVEQLVINSFDILDKYEIKDWYTSDNQTSLRWDFNSVIKDGTYRNRYKSIIISKYFDNCESPHILRWPNDPIVNGKNLIDSFRIFDFDKLRIHHFRKPNLNSNIEFSEDNILINKMKIIRDKYE
jgi:hypothetical protein